MRISREKLLSESEATGFRPDALEKVIHLLSLLQQLQRHPFLPGKLALKGGTALNLFVFDLPRLSVDIDLNYVGAAERDVMLTERPKVEEALRAVCAREGFAIRRIPGEHAGGKWLLRYESALGHGGDLAIDLNFMFRIPLWPPVAHDSHQVGSYGARGIPILDVHELAAGKLAALFARGQPRDIFDVHRLLHRERLDATRLRPAFVLYGAINRKDWRTVSAQDVSLDAQELRNQVFPLIRGDSTLESTGGAAFGARLVSECRTALSMLLPLSEPEVEFLDAVLDRGEVDATLLTTDRQLAARINRHPALQWKILNVRDQLRRGQALNRAVAAEDANTERATL